MKNKPAWLKFEEYVAGLYSKIGFIEVHHNPLPEKDALGYTKGQLDITYRDPANGEARVVECKYHAHPSARVHRKEIAYFLDMLERHGYSPGQAEMVTNTGFTRNAIRLAMERGICLIDNELLDEYRKIA